MGFTRKLQYFITHSMMVPNITSKSLIESGQVKVNGHIVTKNVTITEWDEIVVKGTVLQKARKKIYLKFHKPIGFVSSLNQNVPDNIREFFTDPAELFIAGRLDKMSTGLLLLTNDGIRAQELIHAGSEKEKEYDVRVDSEVDNTFVQAMRQGVDIGTHLTRPCFCERTGPFDFKIILTEGKNRQIRRMCRKLGKNVVALHRTRIDTVDIEGLMPGEWAFTFFNK